MQSCRNVTGEVNQIFEVVNSAASDVSQLQQVKRIVDTMRKQPLQFLEVDVKQQVLGLMEDNQVLQNEVFQLTSLVKSMQEQREHLFNQPVQIQPVVESPTAFEVQSQNERQLSHQCQLLQSQLQQAQISVKQLQNQLNASQEAFHALKQKSAADLLQNQIQIQNQIQQQTTLQLQFTNTSEKLNQLQKNNKQLKEELEIKNALISSNELIIGQQEQKIQKIKSKTDLIGGKINQELTQIKIRMENTKQTIFAQNVQIQSEISRQLQILQNNVQNAVQKVKMEETQEFEIKELQMEESFAQFTKTLQMPNLYHTEHQNDNINTEISLNPQQRLLPVVVQIQQIENQANIADDLIKEIDSYFQ
ncbi:Hypothetical_protein [Hexamita inflata]|uniref:Hypothetical_protein n=1 Tax=Hexamita inflata TaxID=28002 RepID=A0AA86TQV6_9EUKA|nr:Hypothetical protein HINF_LOCUS12645 [Hexamita inflata]